MTEHKISRDNSAESQRSRILKHLREIGSLTTLEARHLLDCCHPGMRICELRKSGYPIAMAWVNDVTPEGFVHRVAKYFLLKRRQSSLFDFILDSSVDNRSKVCR
ncbi:MAG: helix-turn-helix domain-containing protein [Desulforhopalus sp.]